MALSKSSNFSVILPILFVKLAKTPAIAVATLGSRIGHSGGRAGGVDAIGWYMVWFGQCERCKFVMREIGVVLFLLGHGGGRHPVVILAKVYLLLY